MSIETDLLWYYRSTTTVTEHFKWQYMTEARTELRDKGGAGAQISEKSGDGAEIRDIGGAEAENK